VGGEKKEAMRGNSQKKPYFFHSGLFHVFWKKKSLLPKPRDARGSSFSRPGPEKPALGKGLFKRLVSPLYTKAVRLLPKGKNTAKQDLLWKVKRTRGYSFERRAVVYVPGKL